MRIFFSLKARINLEIVLWSVRENPKFKKLLLSPTAQNMFATPNPTNNQSEPPPFDFVKSAVQMAWKSQGRDWRKGA